MSRRTCLVRGLLAALIAGGTVSPAFARAPAGLERLSWLAGCWVREGGEPGSEEQWTRPAAGTMLGMGRVVKDGKLVEFEFMRIHEAADGKLLFTAIPSCQKETTFTELRASASEVVFENPGHDFPQRVGYRFDGQMRAVGSIAGTRKGILRSVEFPMLRVKCYR